MLNLIKDAWNNDKLLFTVMMTIIIFGIVLITITIVCYMNGTLIPTNGHRVHSVMYVNGNPIIF